MKTIKKIIHYFIHFEYEEGRTVHAEFEYSNGWVSGDDYEYATKATFLLLFGRKILWRWEETRLGLWDGNVGNT